jgi:toxin FitB
MECGNPAAACFRQYARMIHRRSDALREDAMIAATARTRTDHRHGSERDCKTVSVPVFDPFRRQHRYF